MINKRQITLVFVLLVLIAGFVIGRAPGQTTIAITLDTDSPPITIPRADAVEVFQMYERHTLVHPMDIKLNAALRVALGDVGKPTLNVSEGHESTAEMKLREWTGGK